jgi:hypothetical protein
MCLIITTDTTVSESVEQLIVGFYIDAQYVNRTFHANKKLYWLSPINVLQLTFVLEIVLVHLFGYVSQVLDFEC